MQMVEKARLAAGCADQERVPADPARQAFGNFTDHPTDFAVTAVRFCTGFDGFGFTAWGGG